jgi:hypothetical protein
MRWKQAKGCRIFENEGWLGPVSFVAHPELAPPAAGCVYARPDDASQAGGTWREQLVAYNSSPGDNPLGLLPAFELYENDIYRAMVKQCGVEKTYILSAGWGLIDAAFLTPAYDITFSAQADKFVRRLLQLFLDSCQHQRGGRVFWQQRVRAALRSPDERGKGRADRVLQFRDPASRTWMQAGQVRDPDEN